MAGTVATALRAKENQQGMETPTTSVQGASGRLAQVRTSLRDRLEPAATGLPTWKLIWWFPGVLLVVFVVLVALGISGSSTGMWWAVFGTGTDPDLLAGQPQGVRSDEWLVQSGWLVSQFQQGFPEFNQTLPGGMDSTVQNDLPSWDWSTLFRPHVAGFLFLGLDRGMAVRWWLPALILLVAAYFLFITLMPRRPITSAALSLVIYLSPLIQWWFVPTTIWPPAFAFLAIAATIWAFRDPRRWIRIVLAAATGYLAVAMVMSIYVPFMVPGVLIFLLIFVALVTQYSRPGALGWATTARRVVPLVVAGIGAAIVLGLWVLTRLDTIKALLGTVYPGNRLDSTGGVNFDGFIALIAGPFNESLTSNINGALGPNPSESATPLLIGIFLMVPLLWIVIRDFKADRYIHWTMIACLIATTVTMAYLLIPGWDWLAHLFFIDRTPPARARMALAILCMLGIVLLIRRLDRGELKLPWSITWTATGLAAASMILVWAVLRSTSDPGLVQSTHWRILVLLFVLSVFLYCRNLVGFATLALLIVAMVIGGNVNPWYKGVFDLNDTAVGQAVLEVNDANPGTWVGLGGYAPMGVLMESGVQAFDGVQTYPADEMWSEIDPSGQYEFEWNRLAHVYWTPGVGEPSATLPGRDQIQLTFDSCSNFAQQHVQYVLSDRPLDQSCATLIEDVPNGPSTFHIYEVTP